MAHKRKRIFDGLYAQLEETDGNVVLFSARGEPSVIFEITNPVQQLCTDAQQYMLFHDVLSNILQTIVSIRPRACFSPSYNKVKSQTKHVWLLTLL